MSKMAAAGYYRASQARDDMKAPEKDSVYERLGSLAALDGKGTRSRDVRKTHPRRWD